MMAVPMVWVVERGMPKWDATVIVAAEAISAANPWIGVNFVIFRPMVFTILQPPKAVARAIVAAERKIIQRGTSNSLMPPERKRSKVITPIVFWPSFEPWLKATKATEQI